MGVRKEAQGENPLCVKMDAGDKAEFVAADVEDENGVTTLDLHGINVGRGLLHRDGIFPVRPAHHLNPPFQPFRRARMLLRGGFQEGFLDNSHAYILYSSRAGVKRNSQTVSRRGRRRDLTPGGGGMPTTKAPPIEFSHAAGCKFQTPFAASRVDRANGVIREVGLSTSAASAVQ